MEFVAPDSKRYRISDCGRYLIEKMQCGTDTLYCIWSYTTQAGGYPSFDEAREACMLREFNRWQAAPQVGTVNYDEIDKIRLRPRPAVEGDI